MEVLVLRTAVSTQMIMSRLNLTQTTPRGTNSVRSTAALDRGVDNTHLNIDAAFGAMANCKITVSQAVAAQAR